jgi:RNA polymerase sigma-70 factor (ECF subfamily)
VDRDDKEAAQPGAGTSPDRWVDEHGDALYRYALAHVRHAGVAQDLVQETFLAALRSRASFAGRSSERTWLIGILKHKIGDHLRRAYRERETWAEDDSPAAGAPLFDERGHWRHREGLGPGQWGRPADLALEDAEFWGVLERCLGALSARSAEAFVLRELDSLSTDEICKVLNVTATNLWVMLHRARMRLRRCLELSWFRQADAGRARGAKQS